MRFDADQRGCTSFAAGLSNAARSKITGPRLPACSTPAAIQAGPRKSLPWRSIVGSEQWPVSKLRRSCSGSGRTALFFYSRFDLDSLKFRKRDMTVVAH
jgi:hypothetical protein